ncbi:GSU3473 family protein [Geobacter sp. DSM 9736]|uniref:GSU3473 family protein n=1 Tax=Geobacter sp. DSM 9736 TaxID=1277350 RepID=UPI000B50AC6C|nr:hypothetical protein [Geobacter sp. DSM 9736]SNB46250.1 hypothetical protein SAMN06269301_1695 [Geobacter sp. DSM 9736]
MTIKVLYPNGVGYVEPAELDELIEKNGILGFFRSNKLVVVGIHKTRTRKTEWHEPERRGWHEPEKRSGTNG